MKKRWIGIAALMLSVAVLGGCAKTDKKEDAKTQTDASVEAADYVTLGEYKGLTISATRPVYSEKDIDLQAKQMYFSYVQPTSGVVDRPVELYDMTNIDYVGKKDGVAFDGGTASGAQLLIGSGQFIEGFEEGLIGVMPGETVDLNLKFPEVYHSADLAGAEVVFTVTVNYIATMEDNEIAGLGMPNVTNVEEFRAYVEDMMNSQAESQYLSAAQDEVFSAVMEQAQFKDFPEELLAKNRVEYADLLDRMAAAYGMDGRAYVEANGGVYEDVLSEYTVMYTKQTVILEAIAKNENLMLTDEALDERLETYAKSSGITVDDLLQEGLTKEDYRQSFLYEDVMSFLVENAVSTAQ